MLGLVAACASAPAHEAAVGNAAPAAVGARWLAVALDDAMLDEGGLELARLDGDKVVPVGDPVPGGQFGWLDAHTLLVVDAKEHELDFTRYVDGKLLDHTALTDGEWPDQAFPEVVITRTDEAWVSKCVLDDNACNDRRSYRRIFPSPSADQDHPPDGIDERRMNDRDDDPWPVPATAPPPPDVTVGLAPVDVEITDPYDRDAAPVHQQVTGVRCVARAAHSTYPQTEWSEPGFDEPTRSVRWVSTDPPIYEVAEDQVNPAGYHHLHRVYARACDTPFDGFAWLGGGVWASFALSSHDPPNGFGAGEPPRYDGDWTFHAGDRTLGTLHGLAALRASLAGR
ncbi:MAG TPA: hypothetical protein VHE35_01135 [Kofleriaceae bacterium]|nr:hypothetical protein [Kofleriaceae bacterium]